jgi:hypothetical protein
VTRRGVSWIGNDRDETPLRLDRGRSQNGIQGERCAGVVRSALDPTAQTIKGARSQRQRRVAGRNLGVEEAAVTAGAAIRRKLQIAMEDLLEGSIGVRFPDGAAPTLGTLMKDRLAPNRESQIRTPLLEMRDPSLSPVAARGSNA